MTIFERLGRLAYRRRWLVVAAWAVLLLVALPLAPRASAALHAGGFNLADLESSRARAVLHDELGLPESALVLVYSSTTTRAGAPAFEAATAAARREVSGAPYVVEVLSYEFAPSQVSADGRTAYDVVLLNIGPDDSPAALPAIEDRMASLPAGPVTIELAGGPAFYGDIQTVSEDDLRRSEFVSLPLAGLALLLVFGSVVAAGVPLAVGGAAVVVSLAAIFVVASFTEMSIFVLNLATLLGLGLGVDYSLLMTSRFREELRRRQPVRRAGRGGRRRRPGHRGHGRTSRLLLGPDRPARASWAGPVRVHDPALGRDRRGDRRRRRGPGRADPAAGDPVDPRAAPRSAGRPSGQCRALGQRALGAPRPAGDAPAAARLPANARPAARPRGTVPARPAERARRHDPAAERPVAGCLRPARCGLRGRAVRAAVSWRSGRPARRPARPTLPPCTTTHGGWRPTPGSPRSAATSISTRGSASPSTSSCTVHPRVRRTASWGHRWQPPPRAT